MSGSFLNFVSVSGTETRFGNRSRHKHRSLAVIFFGQSRHMRQVILICILLTTLYSCGQTPEKKIDYPLQVGDIYFDAKIDDSDFKLCDEDRVFQYYNFGKVRWSNKSGHKHDINLCFYGKEKSTS